MTTLMKMAGAAALALAVSTGAHAIDQQAVEVLGQQDRPKVDCRPEYPPAAVRAQAQGVTTLAFHVSAAGVLTQVDIVKSSGRTREHRMLDEEAARKLSLCQFKAKTDADGNPVDGVYTVHYTWRLE